MVIRWIAVSGRFIVCSRRWIGLERPVSPLRLASPAPMPLVHALPRGPLPWSFGVGVDCLPAARLAAGTASGNPMIRTPGSIEPDGCGSDNLVPVCNDGARPPLHVGRRMPAHFSSGPVGTVARPGRRRAAPNSTCHCAAQGRTTG